jgi:hypothetical protein
MNTCDHVVCPQSLATSGYGSLIRGLPSSYRISDQNFRGTQIRVCRFPFKTLLMELTESRGLTNYSQQI